MATIKEIARRAGVSIGTVDRVLHDRGRVSDEARQRVLQIIGELHYKPNHVAKGLAIMRKKRKLSFFIVDTTEHPFFEQVLEGARQKAEALAAYGMEVEFINIPVSPTQFFDLTGFSTDGIVLIQLPNTEYIFSWAKCNQIPVVCYNIPPLDDYSIAYVGCDYNQAGRIAAGLAAIACGEHGSVGILSEGDERISSYRQREEGFRQEIAECYPDMRIVRSYVTGFGENLCEAAGRMMCEYPDLDLVYLVNPGNYDACRVIRSARAARPVRIITNDLTPSQRSYLENGTITATICQEPEKQGAQALEILFQYLVNGNGPQSRDCFTHLTIHISQNI